jgi:hypothetical protein
MSKKAAEASESFHHVKLSQGGAARVLAGHPLTESLRALWFK